MKRMKRHRVKKEKSPSPKYGANKFDMNECDLTYYLHDRVELLHQVFTVMKSKHIKSIIPDCIKNLNIDDIQELCLEELLGISSKRLCAILDGAEPPSDTASSSEDNDLTNREETISLDSISSDDVVFNDDKVSCKKGKKKKKHHKKSCHEKTSSKSSKKHSKAVTDIKSKPVITSTGEPNSRAAERAGMTVLELLELQARARAIRAQLALENNDKEGSAQLASRAESTDSEVEIKEEPHDVVEIPSSSDEDVKPDRAQLDKIVSRASDRSVTVRKNKEMTVIIPEKQSQGKRIKLKRNNITVSLSNCEVSTSATEINNSAASISTDNTNSAASKSTDNTNSAASKSTDNTNSAASKSKDSESLQPDPDKSNQRKKNTKKPPRNYRKRSQDDDEITLQLSDSEKMDLLEGLDRKNYEKVSDSDDSDSSSSSEADDEGTDTENAKKNSKVSTASKELPDSVYVDSDKCDVSVNSDDKVEKNFGSNIKKTHKTITSKEPDESDVVVDNKHYAAAEPDDNFESNTDKTDKPSKEPIISKDEEFEGKEHHSAAESEHLSIESIVEVMDDDCDTSKLGTKEDKQDDFVQSEAVLQVQNDDSIKNVDHVDSEIKEVESNNKVDFTKMTETKNVHNISCDGDMAVVIGESTSDALEERSSENPVKSDGELSDRTSSEVEVYDKPEEVVTISDEEVSKARKKRKKAKKEKKSKKSQKSDFLLSADENYFELKQATTPDSDEILEICDIFEISDSDDDIIYDGISRLSKEPTSEEIEELSKKIENEIEREDIVDEEQRIELDTSAGESTAIAEAKSWKDRWLESKKVKKVLATSSILNAMRKKNKELKKKIAVSKENTENSITSSNCKDPQEINENSTISTVEDLELGSIDHYNMLEGSTRYVDPVKKSDDCTSDDNSRELAVSMRKDAKQLLKMYKYLLKYNNLGKPSKKIRKKKKDVSGV